MIKLMHDYPDGVKHSTCIQACIDVIHPPVFVLKSHATLWSFPANSTLTLVDLAYFQYPGIRLDTGNKWLHARVLFHVRWVEASAMSLTEKIQDCDRYQYLPRITDLPPWTQFAVHWSFDRYRLTPFLIDVTYVYDVPPRDVIDCNFMRLSSRGRRFLGYTPLIFHEPHLSDSSTPELLAPRKCVD